MVEVTKRFRDAVMLDKAFQEAATKTLPNLIAAWKAKGGRGEDPQPSRVQLLEIDDAMANLDRVMGAALQILRASEDARAGREDETHGKTIRSALFNLSDPQGRHKGAGYDGPGVFSGLQVRRHDNDAERIYDISVAPTASEILSERPPYVPQNAPSTWDRMDHLKPTAQGSPAAVMDTHFRLLRQDFVEPLREAVLGYRREQLKTQENRDGGVSRRGGGVFRAQTEGGRSFMSLYVFKNVQVVGITGTWYGGVCLTLEFDKPDAVQSMTLSKQKDYWERSGRLGVANMVVICEAQVSAVGDTADDGRPAVPVLVFAVISERDTNKLSGRGSRGRIGVSFDSSAGTVAALESMLDLGGGTPDNDRLLMLQPSNSYFAYRPILQVLKSPAREVLPFADTLLPPTDGAPATTGQDASNPKPPRYLLTADTYDLSGLVNTPSPNKGSNRIGGAGSAGVAALRSVSMLDEARFPISDLLENTTLDKAQLEALLAALSQEVALIQGPPGTGKTFVGAKVVRLLLTNRDMLRHWRGPIMCVCLTNHALDQFLCDLLDAGVKDIARVGGSCKTERLRPFMLRELSQARRDSCGREMFQLRDAMKNLDAEFAAEWKWATKLLATQADFRDANGGGTTVVEKLLEIHAPYLLQDAIFNSGNKPVMDEDGYKAVGKVPRGLKDWLAGKNPAHVVRLRCKTKNDRSKANRNARGGQSAGGNKGNADHEGKGGGGRARIETASHPSALHDRTETTKDLKRLEQQRALDRRHTTAAGATAAGAAAGTTKSAASVLPGPTQSPGVGGFHGRGGGNVTMLAEDQTHDDAHAEARPKEAGRDGEDQSGSSAGGAWSATAGRAWLKAIDIVGTRDGNDNSESRDKLPFHFLEGAAEPKNGTFGGDGGDGEDNGGAREQTPSWSFANSGVAAMADEAEWEVVDEEAEQHEEDVQVDHNDGGHLEAKGFSPPGEPSNTRPGPTDARRPAAVPHPTHGMAALVLGRGRRGRGRGRGGTLRGGASRRAPGLDEVGGPGLGSGRGQPVGGEGKSAEDYVADDDDDDDDDADGGDTSQGPVATLEGEDDGDGDGGSDTDDGDADEEEGAVAMSSDSEEFGGSGGSDDEEKNEDGIREGGTSVDGDLSGAQKDYESIMMATQNARSVWALPREERWALCRHWQRAEESESRERLAGMIANFFELKERYDNHKTQGDLAVLQSANVVGMTTTGVAMHQSLVEALGAVVVVVEEAAEVLEAHILAVLTQSTQHLILIGDHLQLRPKAEVYRLTKESRKGFDLDVSMFERLVEEHRVRVHDLATQRRMRPDIADLIRPAVYPNLRDAPHVLGYPSVKGMRRNLFFWDHAVPEDKSGSVASSKTNKHEAKLIAGLVAYLLKQGYTGQGDITVLTPYLGQLFVLKDIVGNSNHLHVQVNERDSAKMDELDEVNKANNTSGSGGHSSSNTTGSIDDDTKPAKIVEVANVRVGSMVRMATVDNFQGEESKIIILSLVRSNRNADIGFLRSSNRVNVALSRAQHGMYIVGNAGRWEMKHGMLESKAGTMWSESVIPTLREKGAIGPTLELQCARHEDNITVIRKHEEFASLAGDGGCSRACSARLPCGHTCVRRCHPDDPRHLGVRCSEPCSRLLQPCEHPCQRLCGDECGPCFQRVKVVELPCGHQAKNVSCRESRQPTSIRCVEPAEHTIPGCGHVVRGRCTATKAAVENPAICPESCGKPLPCGHSCAAKCGRCTTITLSKTPAGTQLQDSAPSQSQQQQHSPSVASAEGSAWAAAAVAMKRDGHNQDESGSAAHAAAVVIAAETRAHHAICEIECGRPRPCGHRCRRPCHEGKPCAPCPEPCALSCEHSSCSQPCVDPCAPCAEECTWSCPHQSGSCRLPCGAPCNRLPCDIRCERRLRCGHQCPSVCGEDCPRSEYCRECGGADTTYMNQVVDVMEFKTLKEHDPSDEPIIVLGCGHAYTLTTLDGLMDLFSAYVKDKETEQWVEPIPLKSDCSTLKPCPDCRAPVSGVSRYNRITNKAKVDMAELKHSQWCLKEIGLAQADLAVAATDRAPPNLRNKRMRQAEGTLQRVVQMSRETPCTRMYEAATAALSRARATPNELATMSRLQPDRSVRVKALAGLGKVKILQTETSRLALTKAVSNLARLSPAPRDPAANTWIADTKRMQTLRGAWALEARSSRAYLDGLNILSAAVEEAKIGRTMAAGAEAKVALADLYIQGVQSVLVSKELALRQVAPDGCNPVQLTEIGRSMVQQGLGVCREVAGSLLASVRERHAVRIKTSMDNLLRLDEALLQEISQEEVEMVKAAAADTQLHGGVTKWYTCPNGHIYGVGDCGMLNGAGNCMECGAAVGGPPAY
ncbi:unnamed protein product [Pylaiella littoralis]